MTERNLKFEAAQRYSAASRRMTKALELLGPGAAFILTPDQQADHKKKGEKIELTVQHTNALAMYNAALKDYLADL